MTISEHLLEGAPNFRDLGGHDAAEGTRVRSNQLFRSDSLARLTDADLLKLKAARIGLIYDLRGQDERTRDPNRLPDPERTQTIFGSDAFELNAVNFFGWRERIKDPNFGPESANLWLLSAYTEMPRLFAGLLSSVIERLSTPNSPVMVIHCTAGKDRTGFLSAMLLLGLGVSRDDVFEDYLLSGRRKPPEVLLAAMLGDELHELPSKVLAALHTMASVREEYLGAALGRIENDFGSVELYLESACGLTSLQRDRLYLRLLD